MTASSTVIVNPITTHTATVVWIHGLGTSSASWSSFVEQLSEQFPHVKWILPNAPSIPVTFQGGQRTTAWFDIRELGLKLTTNEDRDGILDSLAKINQIIKDEVDRGIPSNRIAVGGFSQGGVLSLLTALTSEYKLAAIFGCSGWIPIADTLKNLLSGANKETPIQMYHGDADYDILLEVEQNSFDFIKQLGYNVQLKVFPGMNHSFSPEEALDISSILEKNLGAI
ncbi:Phospholipase/carboxylesterase/thioesterase [Phycomyces blakesleeanus]